MSKNIFPISSIIFSKICYKIDSSIEFSSVCLSVIEASAATLFPMACSYAVALESLTKIVITDSIKQETAPIKDKKLSKLLKTELKRTLNNICPDLDDSSRVPLEIRIDNINQKTNMDSLKLPFEILNISLSSEDIRILKTRNDFLHGRVPLINTDDPNDFDRVNKGLLYVTMRLYTLINLHSISISEKSIVNPVHCYCFLFTQFVENTGVEPVTSCMPCKRSSQLS